MCLVYIFDICYQKWMLIKRNEVGLVPPDSDKNYNLFKLLVRFWIKVFTSEIKSHYPVKIYINKIANLLKLNLVMQIKLFSSFADYNHLKIYHRPRNCHKFEEFPRVGANNSNKKEEEEHCNDSLIIVHS